MMAVERLGWMLVWLLNLGGFIAVQFGWQPSPDIVASVLFAAGLAVAGARYRLLSLEESHSR